MTTLPEIAPCPCGKDPSGDRLSTTSRALRRSWEHQIECGLCGRRGPRILRLSLEDASEASRQSWNRLSVALRLLKKWKAQADAGDPRGGCWEDGETGERMWQASVPHELYFETEEVLGDQE